MRSAGTLSQKLLGWRDLLEIELACILDLEAMYGLMVVLVVIHCDFDIRLMLYWLMNEDHFFALSFNSIFNSDTLGRHAFACIPV